MEKAESVAFAKRNGWKGRVLGDPRGKRAARDGVREPTAIVIRRGGKVIRHIKVRDPGARTAVKFVNRLNLDSLTTEGRAMILRGFSNRNGLTGRADNPRALGFRQFASQSEREDIAVVPFTCSLRRPSDARQIRQGGRLIAIRDCAGDPTVTDFLRMPLGPRAGDSTRVINQSGELAEDKVSAARALGGAEPWMKLEEAKPRFPGVIATSDFLIPDIDRGPVAIQNFMYYCPACEGDRDHFRLQEWQDRHPDVKQIAVTCGSISTAARWGLSRGWRFPIYAYRGELSDSKCLDDLISRRVLKSDRDRFWNSDALLVDGRPEPSSCHFLGHPKSNARSARSCS